MLLMQNLKLLPFKLASSYNGLRGLSIRNAILIEIWRPIIIFEGILPIMQKGCVHLPKMHTTKGRQKLFRAFFQAVKRKF